MDSEVFQDFREVLIWVFTVFAVSLSYVHLATLGSKSGWITIL